MNSPKELGTRIMADEPYGYEDDDEIDLLAYWHIVNRHKWWILGFAAIVCVLTYVVASAMTPVYEATATLMIQQKQANVVSVQQVYGLDMSSRDYLETQFKIMGSREIASRVAHQLHLDQVAEYNPRNPDKMSWRSFVPFLSKEKQKPITKEQEWRAIVGHVEANIDIEPIRNTQLVMVHYYDQEPALAAKIADAVGNAYIESVLQGQLDMTEKANTWLTQKLKGMRKTLEASENQLQNYQDKEHLVNVSGVQTLTAKELNDLTTKLVDARNRTSAAKNQLDAVGNPNANFDPSWETVPAVLQDTLAQNLKQAEADAQNNFSQIQQQYGPKHPKYIAAKSALESARQAYRQRVKQVVQGLEDDYHQALADQQQIQQQLAQSKQQIQNIQRKETHLAELQRDVKTNKKLYDMFFQRFKETSEVNFQSANARFIDQAQVPGAPAKPRKMMITGIAGVLAVMFAVMLAFLRNMLDNTIKVAGEVEEKLAQPVLGVIPLEAKSKKAGEHVPRLYEMHGHNTFSESIRSLRTSVVLSGMETPHKVTVVTSSVPEEGKTTIASNLALALGQMEKVLLLDSDMRRPTIASEYEMKDRLAGLSELVAQTASLEECIHRLPDSHIDVIPAGTVPPNPLDLLSSGRFAHILEELKDKYDRIVIDSAPTQAVSDALVLSTKADALIYVVKSDSTATNVARNGIERLLRVGAPLIGVVLNQFDPNAARKHGYDGYDKYGYYAYGYASKSYE